MSKSSQRKISAYQQGFDDGLKGLRFRWSRHPQIDFYRQGYKEWSKHRISLPIPEMTFIERLLFVVFGRVPADFYSWQVQVMMIEKATP